MKVEVMQILLFHELGQKLQIISRWDSIIYCWIQNNTIIYKQFTVSFWRNACHNLRWYIKSLTEHRMAFWSLARRGNHVMLIFSIIRKFWRLEPWIWFRPNWFNIMVMWIPKLGSPQLFQFRLTQIFSVKYAIRRKKAPKR